MQSQSLDAGRFSADRSATFRPSPARISSARSLSARLSPARLSLDSWAVGLALFAALLVRTGVLKHIPW